MLGLTLTSVCTLIASLITRTGALDWNYHGDLGTRHWDRLFPGACAGKHQSPINIITKETSYNSDLNDFVFWHDPPKPGSKFNILNNGHAVQVNIHGPFFVANGGLPSVYSSAQFHFHWGHANHHGSEHYINGRASPIELHVVNWDADTYETVADAMVKHQGLAVLGVMFEISDRDNPVLTPIIEALDMIQNPDIKMEVEIPATRIRDFLPDDTSKYYRYNGSLTTPGCFESVVWTVFEDKQTISYRQLAKFRKVLEKKHRKHKPRRNRRHMKRGSAAALDEAGIKGNIAEELELEAALKRELESNAPPPDHHDHNPVGHARIGETPTKFQLYDEEVPKQAQEEGDPETKHTTGEHGEHGDHMDHEDHKGQDVEPTPEPEPRHHADHGSHHHGNNAGIEIEVEEIETIQEYLVNNFRPVQPLNGRKIERSFEFDDVRVRYQTDRTRSQNQNSYNNDYNTGNTLYISHIVILMSAILSVFTCL